MTNNRAEFLIKWFLNVFNGRKAPFPRRCFKGIACHMENLLSDKKHSIRLEVNDPLREIDEIYLAYVSDDVVVLELNLARKHQDVTGWGTGFGGTGFHIHDASVKVINLPFRRFVAFSEANRYTCFVAFLRFRAVERASKQCRILYTAPYILEACESVQEVCENEI